MTGRSAVAAVEAELAIRHVLAKYSQGVDRKDWPTLRSCYHDDALDAHGPFVGGPDDFVAWVAARHEHVHSSMHFLGNIAIDLADDLRQARAETYCLTYQHVAGGSGDPFASANSGGGTRVTIACRYVDTLEDRDEVGWRISERTVVYEWIKCEPDDTGYVELDPSWPAFRRDSDDLLYASLPTPASLAPSSS